MNLAGHNFRDGSEPDAVFVTERKILQQIGDAMKSACGELRGSLRADAAQFKYRRVEIYVGHPALRNYCTISYIIAAAFAPTRAEARRIAFASIPETPYIVRSGAKGALSRGSFSCASRATDFMPQKYLGVTARTWVEYLVAILLGNAIYYLSLQPHLPDSLRHRLFNADLGLFLDFSVCAGVYGLIRLGKSL